MALVAQPLPTTTMCNECVALSLWLPVDPRRWGHCEREGKGYSCLTTLEINLQKLEVAIGKQQLLQVPRDLWDALTKTRIRSVGPEVTVWRNDLQTMEEKVSDAIDQLRLSPSRGDQTDALKLERLHSWIVGTIERLPACLEAGAMNEKKRPTAENNPCHRFRDHY